MATDIAATEAPRFRSFDTATVRPHEGFELWCSLFPFTDMAPLRRAPYQSSALLCQDEDGGMLARVRMDATLSDFPEARSDQVMLNLFLQGRSVVQHSGREDVVDPGCGLTLKDCAMPMRTVADPHESIHLLLPRSRVVPLLGPRPYRARPEGGARVWAAARGRCKHRAARYALRALSPLGAAALAPATRLDRESSRGFDQLAGTTRQYGRSR